MVISGHHARSNMVADVYLEPELNQISLHVCLTPPLLGHNLLPLSHLVSVRSSPTSSSSHLSCSSYGSSVITPSLVSRCRTMQTKELSVSFCSSQ